MKNVLSPSSETNMREVACTNDESATLATEAACALPGARNIAAPASSPDHAEGGNAFRCFSGETGTE